MKEKNILVFNGFSGKTIQFLKNLEKNNNKPWFESHKEDYQNYLLKPLREFSSDLGQFMLRIDPFMEVNKTISRIYRDARFSKDKSPYKTCMWITFKRIREDWQEKPAYFFEISADSYRYGMGFYCASKVTMDKFRESVEEDQEEFLKIITPLKKAKRINLEGEKYKKILNNSLSPEILEWYNRKNFYLVCNKKTDDSLLTKNLLRDVVSCFEKLAPIYNYLWKTTK